jgi:hypothetical protein
LYPENFANRNHFLSLTFKVNSFKINLLEQFHRCPTL